MNNILNEIFSVIKSRKTASTDDSYVAKLFSSGREKIAQKVGEEGVEVVIAAIKNDEKEIISESADLLFHLMILWEDANINPEDVMKILQKRQNISGLEEKKNRK